MRVLLFSQYFWPEQFGINDLAESLRRKGLSITVVTGQPNYPDGEIYKGYSAWRISKDFYESVEIIRLPLVPRGRRSFFLLFLNYVSFILTGVTLGPVALWGRSFDLVFVYAPSPLIQALPALLLARLKGARLVLWVQDLWPDSLSATGHVSSRLLLAFVERVVRMIYRSSDKILVPSWAFIDSVCELCNESEKVCYYPNFYRPAKPSKADRFAAELAAKLRSRFSIVFAGNLGTAQSLETIVDAACELRSHVDICFFLVGSGRLEKWLHEQREVLGLTNLILAGRCDPSVLPEIFEASQALLVTLKPEPAFTRTVPSKVQAYLAAGRPILASLDGEGTRIVQEAGAGLCSKAGDAKALAGSVRKLWQMTPQERQEIGRNGRQYFERHFAPDVLTDDLIKHFRELVDKGGMAV